MDRDLVQCVGQLPWTGFVLGCIVLAIFLVVMCAFLLDKMRKLWKQMRLKWKWYQKWQTYRDAKAQKRYEEEVKNWHDSEWREARLARQRRWDLIGDRILLILKYLGYTMLGLVGIWLIWGFVAVIKCLIENGY